VFKLVIIRPEVGVRVTAATLLVVLVMLGGFFLFWDNESAVADPVGAVENTDVVLRVNSVISLAVESCDTGAADYQTTTHVTVQPGRQSSQCQNVAVNTNASGGYSLTMYAHNSNLTHTTITPSPPVIPSTAAAMTSPAALADTTTGTWGFAVPKSQTKAAKLYGCFNPSATVACPSGSGFDNTYTIENNVASSVSKYAAFPTSTTTLAQTNQFTVGADIYTLYFATRIPFNKLGGKYATTITYTAVGEELPEPIPAPSLDFITKTTAIVPNFASTIAPSGNGAGTNGPQFSIYGSGFGSSPIVTIGGKPCTDVIVNSTGTVMTCTGPVSGLLDGEQRTVINGTDAGNDYAVWYTSFNFPTLQSLTTAGTCLGTAANPVIYRDSRDSQLYYVAKLLDNKCWMLDNLKYKPNGDTSGTVTPNFSATQVASAGGYLTQNGTSTSTYPNQDSAKYIDPISVAYCRGKTDISPQNITKCGLLYNFYTATAGTASQSQTTQGSIASGSICPANWHLPTGYNTSSVFSALDIAYGGNGDYQISTPAQLATLWHHTGAWRGVFTGYYNSAFSNQGISGFSSYWTSSVYNAASAYRVLFATDYVYPGTANAYRYNGLGVRCVN